MGEKIVDMHERGAPEAWIRRRFHMTAGEFRDLTGEDPDAGSNNAITGY